MILTSRKITDLNGNDLNLTLSLYIEDKKTITPIVDLHQDAVWYEDTQSMLFAHGLDMNMTLDVEDNIWNQGAESMLRHTKAINVIGNNYPIRYSDLPSITLNNVEIWGYRFYFSQTKYMVMGTRESSGRGKLNQFWFFEEGVPLWLFNFTATLPTSAYRHIFSVPWYDLSSRTAYVYSMIYNDTAYMRPDEFLMQPTVGTSDPNYPGRQPIQCQINLNAVNPSFDLDDVHRYFSDISSSTEWDNDSSEESEGQNGEYNDNSDIIGNDALSDGCLNSSLINNFYLGNDDNQLGTTTVQEKLDIIGQWLCDFDFGSSFSNRLNSLVSLKLFFSAGDPDYEATDTTAGHLIIGGSDVRHEYPGVGYKIVNACRTEQFTQKKIVENFKVQKYFGNFLDYAPHTRIQIYLPFCGMQELDPSLVIDKNLTIWLKTDWVTGDIVYTIHSNGTLIYHFTGNACFDIPISASDYGGKVTSLVSTAISAATMIGGAVSGNAPIAVGGALGIAGNLATLGQKVETYTKGTLANTFSMMDKLQPYLIITRPIQVKATSYASEKGYPSQITANLANVQGFCTIAEWKPKNMPAVPKEVIDRLDTLVRTEGIIL